MGISDGHGAGSSLALGVAIGNDPTSDVGVDGEIGHRFDVGGDNKNIDWSITNVSGNFLDHFDGRRVTPGASFGMRWERSWGSNL